MDSSLTDTALQVDPMGPPDLTNMLQGGKKRHVGHGSFGTVYRYFDTPLEGGEVAVKAITFPRGFPQTEKDVFVRKMRREVGIWRRLNHPNIVSFLGTASGEDFGSDYNCMVSVWMPHGTLIEYLKQHEVTLSLSSRIQFIKGSVAGLEYLHSRNVIHGDFHPGNIMIDRDHNARLIDFGLSQTFIPAQEQLSYLFTNSIRPGAVMWAAPELLYPELYPGLQIEATIHGDIYSLGSIILFILSGKFPWPGRPEAESQLRKFRNPPRPIGPAKVPDGVWKFIEQCWSPRQPRNRPSAQEASSFCKDRLEKLLQPNSRKSSENLSLRETLSMSSLGDRSEQVPQLTSPRRSSDRPSIRESLSLSSFRDRTEQVPRPNAINVVLFGALGCEKSSIINLLAGAQVAQVSADVDPCTKKPQDYQISIGQRQIRLWDTMGFRLPRRGDTSHRLPYEQAHALLRNLPKGVNLILLCARKNEMTTSLGNLYRLLNDFFYDGHAPIVFVATHLDTLDEEWWERNQDTITEKTSIPIQSIPYTCITTVEAGRDQSRQTLMALLEEHAIARAPIPLRLNLSSPLDITHCGLSSSDAAALVKKFKGRG